MKKYLTLVMVVVFALITAACGNSATPKNEASNANSGTSAENGGELSSEPSGESIVMYTNNSGDGRDPWVIEKAKEAGFNVEIVGLGGGDLTARAIAEANNPIADVIWGPSEAQFTDMKAANVLAEFKPIWADTLEEGSYEEDGLSYPYEVQPKIMVVNSELYTEETAPKDYTDLWENPEFHGKYTVPTTFGGSTNRAIIAGILTRYLDEDGELGVSQEGWDAIKAYFDNGHRTPEGEVDFENLANGSVPITYTFASGLKGNQDSFDHKALVVIPEVGLPTNDNHFGVVDKGDQAKFEEAQRFVNWLGSAEAIGAYAEEFGILPKNQDALDKATPEMRNLAENANFQDIDWDYVNSMIEDWIAKIELEIY